VVYVVGRQAGAVVSVVGRQAVVSVVCTLCSGRQAVVSVVYVFGNGKINFCLLQVVHLRLLSSH
jgi:hypothetical protein